MSYQSISSHELDQEAKYYSFILCQTKNIPLSQKLPFIITTLKGKITKPNPSEETYEDFEFNYSFDCVNYLINGKSVILGQGNWIKPLLTPKEINLLESYEIINFEPLELRNQLKFYFYHSKRKNFLQIAPKYLILSDCIVFEEVGHCSQTDFKIVNLTDIENLLKSLEKDHKSFASESFTFQSQYAVMSDIHFLGSFVRGLKPIGSYLRSKDSKEYFHFIEEPLLKNLKRLYPFSNL